MATGIQPSAGGTARHTLILGLLCLVAGARCGTADGPPPHAGADTESARNPGTGPQSAQGQADRTLDAVEGVIQGCRHGTSVPRNVTSQAQAHGIAWLADAQAVDDGAAGLWLLTSPSDGDPGTFPAWRRDLVHLDAEGHELSRGLLDGAGVRLLPGPAGGVWLVAASAEPARLLGTEFGGPASFGEETFTTLVGRVDALGELVASVTVEENLFGSSACTGQRPTLATSDQVTGELVLLRAACGLILSEGDTLAEVGDVERTLLLRIDQTATVHAQTLDLPPQHQLALRDDTLVMSGHSESGVAVRALSLADLSPRWSLTLGNTRSAQATALAFAPQGPVVAGVFSEQLEAGDQVLNSRHGSRDGFVIGIDAGGQVRFARGLGGRSSDNLRALSVGPSGDVFVAGEFRGQAQLGGAELVGASAGSLPDYPYPGHNWEDGFVAPARPGG